MKVKQSITIEQTEFELTIVHSKKRRRTVALSIKPPAHIVIHAPHRTSIAFIDSFIRERTRWILTKFFELKERQNIKTNYEYVEGERFYFLGQIYLLRLIEQQKIKFRCELHEQFLMLYVKPTSEKQDISRYLTKWYQHQAKEKFIERLDYWCKQLHISFNQFFITNAKTRWGSCNTKNDIRINWRLVMMPLALIDYVVVHELCHVIHKNHSKRFWNLVSSVMPDYKQRQNELRNLSRELLLL